MVTNTKTGVVTRTVVVTGAGGGIGRAIAQHHAAHGWAVVGIERDPAAASALRSADMGSAPPIDVVVGDVADESVLREALDRAVVVGRLEAWVNNAAALRDVPLAEVDDDHMRRVLRINVEALVTGARLAVAEFRRTATAGSIVAVSSVHASVGFAAHPLYDASKGAVEAFCRSVAAEAGPHGIRCNAVAPGAVMTEREVEARRSGPLPVEPIPLAMFSSPEEIAAVVGFLTDPASAAINGAVIAADRGLSSVFVDDHWRSAPGRR